METYVAVKSYLDVQVNLGQFLGAYLALKKKVNISESRKVFFSTLEQLRRETLQEALLFDKIYLVELESKSGRKTSDLMREFLEATESGGILSFVTIANVMPNLEPKLDRDNLLSNLLSSKDSLATAEDFVASVESLLDAAENATEPTLSKFSKALANSERKFLELAAARGDTKNRKKGREVKPRNRKNTPEEVNDEALNEMLGFLKQASEHFYPSLDVFTRMQAMKLEYFENLVATPLLSYRSYLQKLPTSRRHDTAQLVIHNLPLPASDTTWEKIIEYRQNPDNRNDLLGLRRWIRKISTEDVSPAECAEELEWLQSEFQAHLRLHKLKTNTATLEVMVKAPLEILENLVTLKFSKLVDPLFAIKKRRISLMEAELNAPGREIAYLVRTKQTFEP